MLNNSFRLQSYDHLMGSKSHWSQRGLFLSQRKTIYLEETCSVPAFPNKYTTKYTSFDHSVISIHTQLDKNRKFKFETIKSYIAYSYYCTWTKKKKERTISYTMICKPCVPTNKCRTVFPWKSKAHSPLPAQANYRNMLSTSMWTLQKLLILTAQVCTVLNVGSHSVLLLRSYHQCHHRIWMLSVGLGKKNLKHRKIVLKFQSAFERLHKLS